jgi:CDP-paratose 2-epimerase
VKPQDTLITGGAGFIGSNLANRLLEEGKRITIYDNLSRPGCKANIAWLQRMHGKRSFRLITADIKDFNTLRQVTEGVNLIYHLAAQVAVTTSVKNPRQDFDDNALGTFNILEAARLSNNDPIIIYASTNKVYGGMEKVAVIEELTRYRFADLPLGIPETQPLDFHSPYGCSKGAGDQYVRDYARIYGLRTVVMRQSCIYGYRQFGIEDQGWLAWFIIAVQRGLRITIYGNGKQVRDVLFIEDLLDAYDAAVKNIATSAGQIYNIGGGPENSISIWAEFGLLLRELYDQPLVINFGDWRPGDQPIYISDIRKAREDLGWYPRVSVRQGIEYLFQWIHDYQELFSKLY